MMPPTRPLTLAALLSLAVPAAALAAGDVLVTVQRGSLRIVGDAADNAIHVVSGGDPETFDVESLDGVTTVNGSLAPFHAVGVERNVKMDLQEGDDEVLLEDAAVAYDLEIVTSAGSDHVEVDDSHVAGNTRISTGVDDDQVVLGTSSFDRSVIVRTDSGADAISLDLVTASDRVKLSTGAGDDTIVIGGGAEFADVVTVATASGDDTLAMDDAAFARRVRASLGVGDDAVTLAATTAENAVLLDGGPESDVYTDGGGNALALGVRMLKIETVL